MHTIPAALGMQLSDEVKPLASHLLLQHLHWNPEEQRAHCTLFKIILETVFFLWLLSSSS